ncbi:MAG TPA: cyclic nucleotide-binding domain-containing protein, partial [Burkholderiales bacterium]|nr:cyclic nucleotide-binding domain-containing protein [Burkholderiales bacterium]
MAQFALNPNVLKNVPLFSSFSDQQLAVLLPAVQHRRFPRGSYVIRAGEETDALYIILAGRAKVL